MYETYFNINETENNPATVTVAEISKIQFINWLVNLTSYKLNSPASFPKPRGYSVITYTLGKN